MLLVALMLPMRMLTPKQTEQIKQKQFFFQTTHECQTKFQQVPHDNTTTPRTASSSKKQAERKTDTVVAVTRAVHARPQTNRTHRQRRQQAVKRIENICTNYRVVARVGQQAACLGQLQAPELGLLLRREPHNKGLLKRTQVRSQRGHDKIRKKGEKEKAIGKTLA